MTMRNNPEYKPRIRGRLLGRSRETEQASIALSQLMSYFHSQGLAPEEATRRLNKSIAVYSELSREDAGIGVSEEYKKRSIMYALIDGGLIGQSDKISEVEEFNLISRGYELNKAHWDKQLGINDGNV